MTAAETRALLAEILTQIPPAESDSSALSSVAPVDPTPQPGKRLARVRTATTRAWSANDLQTPLYWKE
jgi:hypothetical protein